MNLTGESDADLGISATKPKAAAPSPGAKTGESDADVGIGSGGPLPSQESTATGAFEYAIPQVMPAWKHIAPYLETASSYLPEALIGGGPGAGALKQQHESDEDFSTRLEENRARILGTARQLGEQHPVATFAGQTLPAMLLPGAAGTLGKAALTGGLYGAAYGAGEGEDPYDAFNRAWLGAGIGTAGGVLGHGIASGIAGSLAEDATRKATREAAASVNTTIPRFAVSSDPTTQRVMMHMAAWPWVGDWVKSGLEQTGEGLKQAVAGQAGQADARSAGAAMKAGLTDYIGNVSPSAVTARYTALENSITNPGVKTPLGFTRWAAGNIQASRDTVDMGASSAIDKVRQQIGNPDGYTVEGIKKLRTSIGQMLAPGSVLPADMDTAELKQIYKGLTKDMEQAYVNSGVPVSAVRATSAFARDTRLNQEALVKLLGGPQALASNESVYGALARAAGSATKGTSNLELLERAKNAVDPNAWNELASGLASTLGDTPDKFITSYEKNIAPEARDLLFGPAGQGGVRDALDNVLTVQKRLQGLHRKYANTSKSAENIGTFAALFEGVPHVLAHPYSLGAIIPGAAFAKYMTMPATAPLVATMANRYLNFLQNPNNPFTRNAFQRAAAHFGTVAGSQAGVGESPADALYGGNP